MWISVEAAGRSPRAAQLTGDAKEAEPPRQADFTHLTQTVFDERWFVYRQMYLPKAQIKITRKQDVSAERAETILTQKRMLSPSPPL